MSIELEFSRSQRTLLAALLVIPIILLGALGFRYTPVGSEGEAQVLTWSEWQVLQAAQRYEAELVRLQKDAEGLVTLLSQNPDPVRAQLTAERIVTAFAEGEPALRHPREQVVAAALAIQDWAVGLIDHETAAGVLQAALEALEYASE